MRYFELTLPTESLRKLNKTQYKGVMRWLRTCRREVEKGLPFEKVMEKLKDLMLYGKCVIE